MKEKILVQSKKASLEKFQGSSHYLLFFPVFIALIAILRGTIILYSSFTASWFIRWVTRLSGLRMTLPWFIRELSLSHLMCVNDTLNPHSPTFHAICEILFILRIFLFFCSFQVMAPKKKSSRTNWGESSAPPVNFHPRKMRLRSWTNPRPTLITRPSRNPAVRPNHLIDHVPLSLTHLILRTAPQQLTQLILGITSLYQRPFHHQKLSLLWDLDPFKVQSLSLSWNPLPR